MKLKNFNDFSKLNSTDPRNFEKKILFSGESIDLFENMTSPLEVKGFDPGRPILLWNAKSFRSDHINESTGMFIYNREPDKSIEEVYEFCTNESFVPKTIKERSSIKNMKFPIFGISESESEEFATYGKFKKSEKTFKKFREKIVPSNTFNVLAFREHPIHIDEQIGGLSFDITSRTFPFLSKISSILERLNAAIKQDFYKIKVLEKDGALYVTEINSSDKLTPVQQIKMYETAFADYYQSKLPVWFKNQITEKYLVPYFKSKAYDAKLVAPKYGETYEKYLS